MKKSEAKEKLLSSKKSKPSNLGKVNISNAKAIAHTIGLNKEKRHESNSKFFTIIYDNGKPHDAKIFFGKHKNNKLTDIYFENPGYLHFIIIKKFPDPLKEVVRNILIRNDDYNKEDDDAMTNNKKRRDYKKYVTEAAVDDFGEHEGLK